MRLDHKNLPGFHRHALERIEAKTAVATERPETLPPVLWDTFRASAHFRLLDSGASLWSPGDTWTGCCYIVTKGLVRVYHGKTGGGAVTLLGVGVGGIVGKQPQTRPYSTGAEAVGLSEVLALPSDTLEAFFKRPDEFSRQVFWWFRNLMIQQLSQSQTRLQLEHDRAEYKIAYMLLALDGQGLLAQMSRRQRLADLTNLTLETTVRTLSNMVQRGVLESSQLTILTSEERSALAYMSGAFEAPELPYC